MKKGNLYFLGLFIVFLGTVCTFFSCKSYRSSPYAVVEQTVVQPVPVATTTELNPQAKEAFDTLLNIYNNDKNKIIEDFNNYNPQMINTNAPVETNNIDLNNIPVVQQEVQTEGSADDLPFDYWGAVA